MKFKRLLKEGVKYTSDSMKPKYGKNAIGEKGEIKAINQHGIPLSLANFAFRLSQKLRREEFGWLDNIGTRDQARAVEYVIRSCKFDGEEIAMELNFSDLGYTNWEFISEKDGVIRIQSIDDLKNKRTIMIRMK